MCSTTSIYADSFHIELIGNGHNLIDNFNSCDTINPLFRLNVHCINSCEVIRLVHRRDSNLNRVRTFIGTIHSKEELQASCFHVKIIKNIR